LLRRQSVPAQGLRMRRVGWRAHLAGTGGHYDSAAVRQGGFYVQPAVLPILLFCCAVAALGVGLLVVGNVVNPGRRGRVKQMPYESGMDPVHDTRRRFDVHFHLVAIAFLVFDAELLFLYPWAVLIGSGSEVSAASEVPSAPAMSEDRSPGPAAAGQTPVQSPAGGSDTPPAREASEASPWTVRPVFAGGMVFLLILTLGFVYDWRKRVFVWR
jgi:NADH-quinone oxidoreductase subunit A